MTGPRYLVIRRPNGFVVIDQTTREQLTLHKLLEKADRMAAWLNARVPPTKAGKA